jgi:hypothetical protein
MYQAGQQQAKLHRKQRRRRVMIILIILALIGGLIFGVLTLLGKLKPNTKLNQASAVTKKISYAPQTKHYDLPEFGIDLPSDWQPVKIPAGTQYQMYAWQHSEKGTNGEKFEVYQDTIPVNFAVNRVQIVQSLGDHLQLDGSTSDNCSTFTKNLSNTPNQIGAPAKWRSVNFLCDQANQLRNVIGIASTDGINTVIVKNPNSGITHKFFFAYTNQDVTPDYAAFYIALNSFRVR